MTNSNAAEALAWAVDMFGPVAKNFDERAIRMVEEAIELAQAEGVSKETMLKLVERVYSRPAGDVVGEIAAAALTLEMLAENRGLSAPVLAAGEFGRIRGKNREHFAKRHADKVALGIANLSPAGAQS